MAYYFKRSIQFTKANQNYKDKKNRFTILKLREKGDALLLILQKNIQ